MEAAGTKFGLGVTWAGCFCQCVTGLRKHMGRSIPGARKHGREEMFPAPEKLTVEGETDEDCSQAEFCSRNTCKNYGKTEEGVKH